MNIKNKEQLTIENIFGNPPGWILNWDISSMVIFVVVCQQDGIILLDCHNQNLRMTFKILSCIVAMLLSTVLVSQNVLLEEGFEHATNWKMEWNAKIVSNETVVLKNEAIKTPFGHKFLKITYDNYSTLKNNITGKFENHASGYAKLKMSRTMELGKIYEVSFSVLIPKSQIFDTELPGHIGFFLINRDYVKNKFWYINSPFTLTNQQKFDSWVKCKWLVRPTCNLNYLVLGLFKDNIWPGSAAGRQPSSSSIFFDEVKITELSVDAIDPSLISFCNAPDSTMHKFVAFDQASIYFGKSSSKLDATARSMLDSIAKILKANPIQVVAISGFTDKNGERHLELSSERVAAVVRYLVDSHHITKLRFVQKALGISRNSVLDTFNRKVQLQLAEDQFDQVIYRKMIETTTIDSAFYFCSMWFNLTDDEQKILTLFDDRLSRLKQKTSKWQPFSNKIRDSYLKFADPEIAFALDSMYFEDQRYRTLDFHLGNLANTKVEHLHPDMMTWGGVANLDSINFLYAKAFLAKHGFPSILRHGHRASSAIGSILTHHIDSNYLVNMLPKYVLCCVSGNLSWDTYVTLSDKFDVACGRLQKYGTQYCQLGKKKEMLSLCPVDDQIKVNERRQKLGLNPVQNFDASFMMKK